MATALLSFAMLVTAVTWSSVTSQVSDTSCGSFNCRSDQFCFSGARETRCVDCNTACDGCTGPGADECVQCQTGYYDNSAVCEVCPVGRFGNSCNGTCHCLDADVCDHVTGKCVGKCEKGFYKPPQCQDECPDGFYGLDCLGECHCFNDSVCEKILGFCPGNLCHPDWTSYGCSKRLPKLATPPSVTVATCDYLTVVWSAWNTDDDFGDLPVAEYRLYSRRNGSDSQDWRLEVTLKDNSSVKVYMRNVTNLQQDDYYVFRVDVHYSDDDKVVPTTSMGIVSDPPTLVPCTTTTAPPPITVPIIVGTEVFSAMSSSNEPDGSLLVTWSIDPDLRRFTWNVTLFYQVIGTGNCPSSSSDAVVTSVPVNQSDILYRLSQPAEWSRYKIELSAEGTGIIDGVNGTEDITAVTAEILPSGNVSNLRTTDIHSTSVTITWDNVPCVQRGGALLRYDVMVGPHNVTTNQTSVPVKNLLPFTNYTATARYVNQVGAGPWCEELSFTTAEGVPAAVSISSLQPTTTTVVVNFSPPKPANGVILDYYIMYGDSASFSSPESLTHSASSPDSSPVIRRLDPETTYYFKVRARTGAGYGAYGRAMNTTTLQASPAAPTSLLQTARNLTCVSITWLPPDQTIIVVTGYTVTIINRSNGQGNTYSLPANVTVFTRCNLDPGSVYNISVTSRSGTGSGKPTSIEVTTEQAEPPPPSSPVLLNVSFTSATIEIEPVTFDKGPLSAYQIEAERISPPDNSTSSARRKRLAEVPGYVTAELTVDQVTERRVFVIGDGQEYGGYVNLPLLQGQEYQVRYVVISTLGDVTKFSVSKMLQTIVTLVPTTTTVSTSTSTQMQVSSEDDDNGVLIGIIIALIFVIIIIILLIIFIIWWRRRHNSMLNPPPYLELNEGQKAKPTLPKEEYDPEKYWNQITSLRESHYIVVGRECLPNDQLVPVSTQIAEPGSPKVTFKKEFQSLPHKFEQATTSEAEQHPDRNRFPHILAYDHSRVELSPDASSRVTYINASFMSGYKRQRCYISAQSPYDDSTAVDFWRLIHQHNIKTVVMLANVVEDNIVKCTQFWPQEGKVSIGSFYLELQEEEVYADFIVRDVSVRESREQYGRTVRLFEFTSWPDHGVPDDPIPFLDMRYKVRQYHADEVGPILVHCGTGVARTGVFVAVDSLIDQYASEGRISVFSFVRKMRKERPLMVRTYKQYVFIYQCLLEEFQAGDTMTDAVSIKPKYHDWTKRNSKTGHSFLRDQFQLLQRLTPGPQAEHCKAALLPENVQRNRYPDVVPSDRHRPHLHTPASLSNTDYINAIFVDGYKKRKQFIITQTPLHTTLVDFWRLIYDHRVTTIVMMDNYKNADDTCAEYWPTDVIMKQWEPFFVETTAAFQQENVTIRNLKMVNTQRPRDPPHMVRQFQFNAWAENSFTPVSKTMALDLLDLVLDYQDSSDRPDSPIVVHCEDGATHSGLFVSLALLCERIDEEQEVDVYHVIKHVKWRRTQIIHDYDQFRFCYKALWDYINLRMPGGTFTDTLGQNKTDRLYGAASLSLTSHQDSLY